MNELLTEIIENPYGEDTECIKMVIDDITQPFQFNDIKDFCNAYTFSTWIKGDGQLSVMVNDEQFHFATDWFKIGTTFTADTEVLELYFCDVGAYYLYHPKLEGGNKVTDWTPAPEDISESIAKAQNTADSKPSTFKGDYILTTTEEIIYYKDNEDGTRSYFCKVEDTYFQVTEADGVYTKTDTTIEVDADVLTTLETTPIPPYKVGDIWTTAAGYSKTCIIQSDDVFDDHDWTSSMEVIVSEFRQAQALIQQLTDKIRMIVVDENGTSLMEQTGDGFQINFYKALTSITDLESYNEIKPYIREGVIKDENGNPVEAYLEIGKTGDPFKVQLTPKEMRFMENQNKVAYISNEFLNIKDANIDNSLNLGDFELRARANGNLGIRWKGEI